MRHALLAFASFLLAPFGCHRSIESICRQSCECQPCTDADLEDCIDRANKAQEAALKKDCDTKLDAYLTCVDDHLSCQNGAGPGTTACVKQEQALIDCTGSGNPFATPCQQAAQKFAMCNNQPAPPGTGSTCPADQACQSLCVVQAPCSVLVTGEFNQQFQDCVNACFTK
jgi:hypothetical protein